MHKETLDLLRCPLCAGDVESYVVSELYDGEIISGKVRCTECGGTYCIEDGVLDLAVCAEQSLREEIKHWDIAATTERIPADLETSRELRPKIGEVISEALKGWHRRQNLVVLEICCGKGTALNILPHVIGNVHYVGVDISRGMLLEARGRKRQGWKVDLVRADANKQLMKNAKADLCFSFAALHHLRLHDALKSIHSSLMKKGLLVLYEPNRYNVCRAVGHNLVRSFYTSGEQALSPFRTRAIARSLRMALFSEKGLYSIGLPFSFLIGFLENRKPMLARHLRKLTPIVVWFDVFISKKSTLSLVLSSATFQCFMKQE